MALTSKLPMNMLLGANGQGYTPQGGINDAIWGQRNLQAARHHENVQHIADMGKPGAGFLNTTKYGLPNSTWDGYHGLMMGLRDATMQRGQKLQVLGSRPQPAYSDTRFDPDQVDARTGHTLLDDTYGDRNDLKTPLDVLRKQFGL